jgi:hypothetical protein
MADKNDPLVQLGAVYGKKKAKKIWKEVQKHKASHPGKAFSFVFAEDGTWTAVEKKKEKDDTAN